MRKVYRVLKRKGEWQVLLPHAQAAILAGDESQALVRLACELAQKQDGEVQVYDSAGNPQVTYTYAEGLEKRTLLSRADSDLRSP